MMIRFLSALTLLTCLCASSFAQSRTLELAAAQGGDLRAESLVTAPDMPLANTSRDAVSYTWQAAQAPVFGVPVPYRATSRSFGLNVSAAELDKGVTVRLDAPGGVVRVSAQRAGALIDPEQLIIALPSGREMTARAATDQLVQRADLDAATGGGNGQGFGIRLARELGAGDFTLRYPMSRRDDRLRVDVFDRNSDAVLNLQSTAGQFMRAADAAVRVDWVGNVSASVNSGFALAPDGTEHRLVFDGNGHARLAAPQRAAYQAGLWEWHVQAVAADGIRRDIKTVFALTPAVARLDNSATVLSEPDRVLVTVGTQVQSAGRYEVRATLFGTNADGQQVPALTSATAKWLEPGRGELSLSFDAPELKALGLRAPFALRNLSLLDQSRMGTLELRRNALTF